MTIEVKPDWWKSMFDEVYLKTDARSVCDEKITRREIDVVLDLLPIETNHRILDLCGGHGRHSLELCARGYKACTVLDYSKVLIDCAKTRADECNYSLHLVCCDVRDTGLPPEHFDHALIMGNSLGYIQSAGADIQILKEAHRILRSDGWLLVDVTDGPKIKKTFSPRSWHEIDSEVVVCRQRELRENTIVAREMVISKTSGLIRDENYAVRLYDARTLAELFTGAGFEQVEVQTDFSPHQAKGDFGFMNARMIATGRKP